MWDMQNFSYIVGETQLHRGTLYKCKYAKSLVYIRGMHIQLV